VAELRAGRQEFDSRQMKEFLSSPPRLERCWGPPSLLSNAYWGLLPREWSDWVMKLTTHLHLGTEAKNMWSYTSTPQYVSMAWFLLKHSILLHGVVI